MRKMLVLLAAAAVLSGCASTLQNAYDEQSRTQCEQENHGRDRINC